MRIDYPGHPMHRKKGVFVRAATFDLPQIGRAGLPVVVVRFEDEEGSWEIGFDPKQVRPA